MTRAALAGDWNSLVVLCAANSWDAVKMMDQHLAQHLSSQTPVLYVDPPLSRLTVLRRPEFAASVQAPRLRLLGPSLARLTPVVLPGPLRPAMVRVTTELVRRAVRRAIGALGSSVRAVVVTMPLVQMLGTCNERLRVYWAQDDFVAGAELFGLSRDRIRKAECRVAAEADVIVASNPNVASGWRSRGYNAVLIPFGCDHPLFAGSDEARLPTDVRLPTPIAGLIGHLGDRIDIRLLEAVADRGRSLLLIGPRHPRLGIERFNGLLARANVQWIGPKPFEELPSYHRMIDVGLVPYTTSAFNLGSFPLKTLEYLAAGRPVVATDLPATRWLETDLITIESEPQPFAEAVDRALREPRTGQVVDRRRAFAAKHSWAARAAQFGRVLGLQPSAERRIGAEAI